MPAPYRNRGRGYSGVVFSKLSWAVPESKDQKSSPSSFFTIARFGPGMIIILLILISSSVIVFSFTGSILIAILPAVSAAGLVAIKSFEVIQPGRPVERTLVGQRCLVVKAVGRSQKGIVRIFDTDGELNPELWSAELARAEGVKEIGENQVARVVGTRSVILLVEPI